MRLLRKKMTRHQLPESTDRLGDVDETARIRYVLELWKEKSNGQFSFSLDSQGKFSLQFRAAPLSISSHEILGHAICRVIPEHPLPPLIVKYPFDATCLRSLTEWFEKGIYCSLDFLNTPGGQESEKGLVMITTKACISKQHITAASVLHALTEVTDGYWQLAKALFHTGLLDEGLSRLSYAKDAVVGILNSLEDVETGVLTGKLARQMLPDDIPSMLKKDTVPLPFHNLIGDEPGGSMDQLREHIRTRALAMGASSERARTLTGSGHFDIYSIHSKYLKEFMTSVTELLRETGRKLQLETIHQGFPGLPLGRVRGSRKIFLAIRYAIDLADVNSIETKKLQEWREFLLFTNRPRTPTCYDITNESVRFLTTLPFAIEEKANYPYSEFGVDNKTYDLSNLIQKLNDFSTEIDRFQAVP